MYKLLNFLGSLSENDTWVAKKLTTDHNTDNQAEIKRILEDHPGEQKRNIFRGDRLLGMLAPLRAFGDFRFKWDRNVIMDTIGGLLGNMAVPEDYKTPPYLTVEPDVIAQKLTPKDKFLVIGSDGLWDMMTPMQVIFLAFFPCFFRGWVSVVIVVEFLSGAGENQLIFTFK